MTIERASIDEGPARLGSVASIAGAVVQATVAAGAAIGARLACNALLTGLLLLIVVYVLFVWRCEVLLGLLCYEPSRIARASRAYCRVWPPMRSALDVFVTAP